MSSFLGDLVGNLALAGGAVTKDYIDQQQALERQKNESDLAMERQRAAEVLRAEFETKRDQIRADRAEADRVAKQKRLSEQGQAIEAQAPGVTAARQLSEAQRVAPSVDSSVMDVIKSRLTPAQIREYYGVDDSAVASVNDKISVARKNGYYDIEEDLQKDRTAAVAAAKAALEERKADMRHNEIMQGYKTSERNADVRAGATVDAATVRADAKGSGGAGSAERLDVTRAREKRVDIQQQITTVINANKEGLMDTKTAQAELTRLRALQKKYQDIEDSADAAPAPKPGAPAAKPAAAAAPAPAARPPLASFKK